MRPADVEAVRTVLRRMDHPRTVMVFSPAIDFIGNGALESVALAAEWPSTEVIETERSLWDLDGPMPPGTRTAEVGLLCNTFMCSRDPGLWLRHLSAAVPVVVIQDLAVCRRGHDGRHRSVETGDVARYNVSSHAIMGETDPGSEIFDLAGAGYPVLDAEGYADGDSMKFVAVLRLR